MTTDAQTKNGQTPDWAALPEAIAPPQANGELLFDAPWQGRAFGMVHSLVDAGQFSWDEFREQLIIALEQGAVGSERYYECFLQALEQTLIGKTLVGQDLLDSRTEEFAARPHGHDH